MTKETKIRFAETLFLPSHMKAKTGPSEKKKNKKKSRCFWAMGLKKNSKSVRDRKEVKEISEKLRPKFARSHEKNIEN